MKHNDTPKYALHDKNTIIIFHDDEDGWASASVIHHFNKKIPTKNYYYTNYHQPFPYQLINSDSEVYILDFSYSREIIEDIKSKVKSLIVIDHHETSKQNLEGLDYCIFDQTHSGCVLTWKYFSDCNTPLFLGLVEDYDLYTKKHDSTAAFIASIRHYGVMRDLNTWSNFYTYGYNDMFHFLKPGKVLVDNLNNQINDFIKSNNTYKLANYEGISVAVFNRTNNPNEYCEGLYNAFNIDVAICFSINAKGIISFSFRSRKGNDSALKIATLLGGGGHPAASGVKLPFDKGMEFLNLIYNS